MTNGEMVEKVIEHAYEHGNLSGTDYEVGDLQEALREALRIMDTDQAEAWFSSLQALLGMGDSEDD